MQSVILAAGLGKRLNSNIPKALIKIQGKPILEHTLKNISQFVDEIMIIIGKKGNQIKTYFGNNFNGIPIKYVIQQEPLGTAHALDQAKPYVKDKFIVSMGDNFYSKQDIQECLKHNLSTLAQEVEDPSRFGVFLLDNGYIKEVVEKPKEFVSNLVNTGFYLFDRRIFDEIQKLEKSERGEYELTEALLNLAKKTNIKCVKVSQLWFAIDRKDDISIADNQLASFLKD